MFAVPMWENQDTETATYLQSEVTDAKLPIISKGDVKTLPKSARGRIIRQGIKFNSFKEFCNYVDGGNKFQVLRKEKRSRKYDSTGYMENSDVHRSKKQKFNVKKLNDMLSEDKDRVASPNSPVTPIKLSNSEAKLRTSRFRYLNQQLYTQTGEASFKMFKKDPAAFKAYHEGYMEQASKWPAGDPLQKIIEDIKKQCKTSRLESIQIADFGCGEARLARHLPSFNITSLDLVALKPDVIACDMGNSPLNANSMDIVVFCLSLMGTNLKDYLSEANRVLKTGGTMKIAEVRSRFANIGTGSFITTVNKYGFKMMPDSREDNNEGYFLFFDFKKNHNCVNKKKLPELLLKPCIYKKR